MESQYPIQLTSKAERFVHDYSNSADDDISRIIAGMVSIIDGNEQSFENMKNQRWFERIWYDLTGKNKATVREMQANRDSLTQYTIQILVRMNSIIQDHSTCINDLYRALAVIRDQLNTIPSVVDELADKLDDRIKSIDNYNYILNEIRNGKFNCDSALISMIDVLSMIDSRTASQKQKLVQLKETMEAVGFDFSHPVDINSYSEDVVSLPEDRVGRILLFCKCYSYGSQILKYTCTLIEEYFYQLSSYERLGSNRENVISAVLRQYGMESNWKCKIDLLFDYLKKQLGIQAESSIGMIEDIEVNRESISNQKNNVDIIPNCTEQLHTQLNDFSETETVSFPIPDLDKSSGAETRKVDIISETIYKMIDKGKGCYSLKDVYSKTAIFENARKRFGFRATGSIIGLIDTSDGEGSKGVLFTTDGIAIEQAIFIRYHEIIDVKPYRNQILIYGNFKNRPQDKQVVIDESAIVADEFIELISLLKTL